MTSINWKTFANVGRIAMQSIFETIENAQNFFLIRQISYEKKSENQEQFYLQHLANSFCSDVDATLYPVMLNARAC